MSGFYQMDVKTSPYLRSYFNVGCLMDIPPGAPVLAEHGRYVCNGGHNGSVIFVGPGNSYKSALADHVNETAMFRAHRYSSGLKYDTENNVNMPGLEQRLAKIVAPFEPDWFQTGRWAVTESSLYKLDKWFPKAKEWMNGKEKQGAEMKCETPIVDRSGKKMKILRPTALTFDSLSKAEAQQVQDLRDATVIGDSKQKMLHMNSGLIKKNMVDELPDLLVSTNTYLTGTVHYGEKFQLDSYAPQHKSLQYIDTGMELKGAPKNINYLSMSMWLIRKVDKCMTASRDGIRYPLKDAGNDNSTEDLNIVNMRMLRCKTGPSGYDIEVIVSQKYGVLESLTQFHFIRTNGQFGLTGDMSANGNFRDSYCVLYPDVKLTRTNIRSLMDDDLRLARAISLCSDLLQMSIHWREHLRRIDERLIAFTEKPETLREAVIKQGYDWNMVLDTRYWYSLDDDYHQQLELSTVDIMRMGLGLYHPFWLEADKKTIKKKYQKKFNTNEHMAAAFEDAAEQAEKA